ncbi:carboxypeptidase regulatory-like domain-containing protein [Rosistilla oblonga]|uniref:carboxypeptidase regulatory-like domain-containing protein n=1 Tax=Rosistilla oblonga TaxID=2527990 RepID=UPI003A970B68
MSFFKSWTSRTKSNKRSNLRRSRSGRRRGIRLESLERRDLLAVDIVFDYTYDDSGFFDTQAKAALERAATDYETRLLDTLTAIPAPTGGNSWTASFQDPETGSTVNLPNLQLAENEVRVFVGSRNLTGSTLGKASAGYGVQYTDPNWVDTVLWRGQSGANEQSTWGGSIVFDTSPTWHFDVGLPTSGTTDFYSVALHELGHIFGISNQPGNTWTSLTKSLSELSTADQALVDNEPGDYFTGPKSVALYGSPIPADGGHFEHDVSYAGAEAALDPSLTTGTRKPMSPLDWTTLDDIGWDIGTRFLSGTVFDDSVIDNDHPDAGEGEAGITVTATNTTTSTQYTTTTHTDGTYALELPPGTYDIIFTGGGYEGQAEVNGNNASSGNIHVDLNTTDTNWSSSGSADQLGLFQAGRFYLDTTGNGGWDTTTGGDSFYNFGISSIESTATLVVGDWDGDGTDDLGLFNNGNFYLDTTGNGTWDKVSGGDTFRNFGIPAIASTARPVIGDWNGDGTDDLGLFHNGNYYLDTTGNGIWDKTVGGDTFRNFGISSIAATATPVVGDWDGDGTDDLGLYNDGRFYLDTTGNGIWDRTVGGDTFYNFGITSIEVTAIPVIGDWDGDGVDDLGLFNKGNFYLDTTGNGKWDKTVGGDTFNNYGISSIATTAAPVVGIWATS